MALALFPPATPESVANRIIVAALRNKPGKILSLLAEHPGMDLKQALNKPVHDPLHTFLSDPSRVPVLHVVVRQGRPLVLSALLAAGADPNAIDGGGATPLHRVADSGASEAVDILLKAGARMDTLNTNGNTPLIHALLACSDPDKRTACSKVVRQFLEAGADPNTLSGAGCSALFHASAMGMVEEIKLLLSLHANPLTPDSLGRLPLEVSISMRDYRPHDRTDGPDEVAQVLVPAMFALEFWKDRNLAAAAQIWRRIPKEWHVYGKGAFEDMRRHLTHAAAPGPAPRSRQPAKAAPGTRP